MNPGDLVEITFGTLDEEGCRTLGHPYPETGIYIEPDHASSWINGEPSRASRVMVLWDGDVHSVPTIQVEVIYENA